MDINNYSYSRCGDVKRETIKEYDNDYYYLKIDYVINFFGDKFYTLTAYNNDFSIDVFEENETRAGIFTDAVNVLKRLVLYAYNEKNKTAV